MQKTIYTCDQCEKEIGNKRHITLVMAANMVASGIAVPPSKGQSTWGVHHKLNGKFLHFCNGVCIGRYFSALLKKTLVIGQLKKP